MEGKEKGRGDGRRERRGGREENVKSVKPRAHKVASSAPDCPRAY